MDFSENITFRRQRTKSYSSNNSDDDTFNQTGYNCSATSLPNLSLSPEENEIQLKEKNAALILELESAHKEIDNLMTENNNLRKTNEALIKKNNLYKKITSSPIKQKQTTPKKSSNVTINYKQTQTTPMTRNIEEVTNTVDKTNLSKLIDLKTIEQKTKDHNMIKEDNIQPELLTRKHKICILSTNKQNDTLKTAEKYFGDYSNVVHYIKPGGDTKQLLQGIRTKLANFTMNDYCVLFIADEDFKVTQNYIGIINCLRKTFEDINFTNIIICTPTYRCNYYSNVYNWRVKIFNNLLYKDIMSHQYAYLLDSNCNLIYNSTMFYKNSGIINNFALNVIFYDINQLIDDIDFNNANIFNVNNSYNKFNDQKQCDQLFL